MLFRAFVFSLLGLLVACGPRHEILGTTYGYDGATTQILLDANIDRLRVRHVRRPSNECQSGFYDHLEIAGEIGPDSTAAIGRLLPQLQRCVSVTTGNRVANLAYLSSGGGYLSDGYALGELFREYEVNTIITGGQVCASSCAIAFLGGVYRTMQYDAMLLFHAPYTSNGIAIDCTDRGQVAGLQNYYEDVLGTENGNFLLERTLSYCSASSGWTLNADGAKLFGITNTN